jgi:DNA processing protein
MQPTDFFEKTGGKILGRAGPFELGRLIRAPSVPRLAYVRGNPELLRSRPAVAIVGTRKPSAVGLKRAFDYSASLASAGCLIVSGGAMGIDYAAHRGALSVGAETLVVLGDPVSETGDERPRRILDLEPFDKVTTVTAYGPGTKIGKTLFVARNQYIAALSDAVVIIEGTLNSGTLHTARYAQKMGVPIWAVPGDPDNQLAEAANSLLETSDARALYRLDALLQSLGLIQEGVSKEDLKDAGPLYPYFRAHNDRVTLDLLCELMPGEPVSYLQTELLQLELLGLIQREGSEFVLAS